MLDDEIKMAMEHHLISSRRYIFKWLCFHCHASFRGYKICLRKKATKCKLNMQKKVVPSRIKRVKSCTVNEWGLWMDVVYFFQGNLALLDAQFLKRPFKPIQDMQDMP